MELKILCAARRNFQIGSFIIQKVERMPFSHFAVLVDGFVYEAVWPKSKASYFDLWLHDYRVVRYFDFSTEDECIIKKTRGFISRNNGVRFSILQILIIALSYVISPLKYSILNGKKKLICSEYVARLLLEIFNKPFKKPFDCLSLRNVYRACLQVEKGRK
ncbi:MAG TPA: hypothetical protein VFF49_04845 [Thermodesulfobacteriota bacterium]|nr:hypothetical protein [Thermodesulfobacteriota bacterium]